MGYYLLEVKSSMCGLSWYIINEDLSRLNALKGIIENHLADDSKEDFTEVLQLLDKEGFTYSTSEDYGTFIKTLADGSKILTIDVTSYILNPYTLQIVERF